MTGTPTPAEPAAPDVPVLGKAEPSAALSSPGALLRAFPPHRSPAADAVAAFEAVRALASAGERAEARAALLGALRSAEDSAVPAHDSPPRRRRVKGPEESDQPCCSGPAEPPSWAWVPAAVAAALPLLEGALPRDERGLCVIPHPHPLVQKRSVRNRRFLTAGGRLAYDTQRACDNCDKSIQDRSWFACAEGCDVDFCLKCHKRLQEIFAGRDIDLASWAAQFVTRASVHVLRFMVPAERKALLNELAFEWPVHMFERLVRAVAEVADAKVVHLEDGANTDIMMDPDFWHILGLLQLLRLANELPMQELRFGELALRGPRVPSELFVLGAIDKCDAQAEWQRWHRRPRVAPPPEKVLLEAEPFEASRDFALFLAHGCVVPIGFRQRCLLEDVHDALQAAPGRPAREIKLRVTREPGAIREAAVAALGGGSDADPACLLSVRFLGEPGEGPGVTREFMSLALQSMLSDARLWEYEPQLRTYWFAEPAVESPQAYHACGALLGQAVLTGTQLPAALPRVLFGLLLHALGSPKAMTPSLADLALVQPSLARGLRELLEYQGQDVAEVYPLSWPRGEELSSANRAEHVEAYVAWFFAERFAAQLRPLCAGFQAMLGRSELLRSHVDAGQLDQIICGTAAAVDVGAIRRNAETTGWAAGDLEYVNSFWDTFESLTDAEKYNFIVFVSACGRMPPQGWQDFTFCLQKNGAGDDRLPTAYTCFHLLLLPRYTSVDVLRSRLKAAIAETEGFGLN